MSDPESTPTASQVLRSLAASKEGAVSVGAVVSAVGSRAHGIALIVFALPDTVPLPLPSLSTVLGVPLVLIAAHLVLFGEDSGLPNRVLATAIPTSALRVGVRYVAPVLEAMELATRPRLTAIMRPGRWLGLVCLYLAILLLLPLPLLNFAPAVCLVAIALAMVQRDGILMLFGLAGTALLTLSLGFVAQWLSALLAGLREFGV